MKKVTAAKIRVMAVMEMAMCCSSLPLKALCGGRY